MSNAYSPNVSNPTEQAGVKVPSAPPSPPVSPGDKSYNPAKKAGISNRLRRHDQSGKRSKTIKGGR